MMKQILLLSGNHLSSNPRVFKEAEALADNGFEVEVLGSGASLAYRPRDEKLASGKKWKFSGLGSEWSAVEKNLSRAQRYCGNQAHRWLGWENSWQLGPMAELLWKEGKKRSTDLYIAHSEAGMWAAEQLRKEGKRVGVDMEDWFSEDLLPEARRARPIRLLKKLEKNLLCHGVHSTCTSEAMADALVEAYGCRRPTVIRNVFPREDREALDGKWKDRPGMARWMPSNDPKAARPKEAPVSIHWFSQSIGPGRGLETLFGALVSLQGNWEVHLRGNLKGYEKWLESACPVSVQAKLKVHELVDNNELLSRIAEHDIAFAGELSEPPSRNLTITNKFFQYLQAGLAVIASDTAGQTEAAKETGGAVFVVPSNKPDGLKAILAELLNSPELLRAQKQQSWIAADRLNWEKESRKLVSGLFFA
jgi:glycosyltransferase involved in cell wall biosynthesis